MRKAHSVSTDGFDEILKGVLALEPARSGDGEQASGKEFAIG